MTPSFALFTFINVWWITLFFMLPFGVRKNGEPSKLEYAAAPRAHKWKKLFLINSAISLAVTAGIALLMHSGVISLKNT